MTTETQRLDPLAEKAAVLLLDAADALHALVAAHDADPKVPGPCECPLCVDARPAAAIARLFGDLLRGELTGSPLLIERDLREARRHGRDEEARTLDMLLAQARTLDMQLASVRGTETPVFVPAAVPPQGTAGNPFFPKQRNP